MTNMKALLLICGTVLMVSIVGVFGVLKLDSNRAERNELVSSSELSGTVAAVTEENSETSDVKKANNVSKNTIEEDNRKPSPEEVTKMLDNVGEMIRRREYQAADIELSRLEEKYTLTGEHELMSYDLWEAILEETKDEKANNWTLEEAINIYETAFDNQISWENYREDLWSVVDDFTHDNTTTLHFKNISGAGGSYTQFIKDNDVTEVIEFDGNASFPNEPYVKHTVRNSDYKIIKTEEL